MIEAKDWATLDTWDEYSVKVEKKIDKLLKKIKEEEIDKDVIRQYRGSLISQEMIFK